jgi:hypothetical protein
MIVINKPLAGDGESLSIGALLGEHGGGGAHLLGSLIER